jgi:hypothetical protein
MHIQLKPAKRLHQNTDQKNDDAGNQEDAFFRICLPLLKKFILMAA